GRRHRGVPPQPGHPHDGRPQGEDAGHAAHVPRELPGDRGHLPILGLLLEDEILLHRYINGSAWSPGVNYYVYIAGAIAAFCTAFYMFRLYCLTFEGKFRGDHHTWQHYVKEYWIMSMPLVLLAIAATFGGLLGWPHGLHGIAPIPHV